MIPFMTVLSFAMLGCTMFFMIHLPSESFEESNHGLFQMVVGVYHMMLGLGQCVETITPDDAPMTVLVSTVFTSFVVVVL